MMNLYSVLSANVPVHFATNDNDARLDLAADSRTLADDKRIWSENFSPKHATNADCALKAKLSLELATAI
jgi:hypothetical protein